jgi:hypothetical protein
MELISLLELLLRLQSVALDIERSQSKPTESRSTALISPSYGFAVTGVDAPERSSIATLAIDLGEAIMSNYSGS